MLDPSLLDPSVMKAAKSAGLDPSSIPDANHNGKIDVQDVALAQVSQNTSTTIPAPIISVS
jgi:hypothetical protein